MDRTTLSYLADTAMQDSSTLCFAIQSGSSIGDEELKRVINTKLDLLTADIANLRHFIEA